MNIFKQTGLLLLVIIGFSACDEVELPHGEQEEEGCFDIVETDETRRVLLIDFTGHLCANCPAAAIESRDIESDFPDNVVVMAVHPDIEGLTTPLSGGSSFTTEWRTSEGNFYQSNYELLTAIPLGAVSGTQQNGNYWSQMFNWRPLIEPLVLETRKVSIDLSTTYDDVSREISISTSVDFYEPLEGDYNMVLATVESNITDWQKNGTDTSPADPAYEGGNISNYVHKHVLRNHINGLEGEAIVAECINGGDQFNFNNSSVLDAEFVAEEVSVYAYVYDTESLEILDVTEVHIIE